MLSAETQDEVAVAHLLEWKSGIHKLEVPIAFPVSIGDSCPNGHDPRMKPSISLAEPKRETQLDPIFGIHTEGTTDDLAPI